MNPIILITIAILVIAGAAYYFFFFEKSDPQILETRDFSCPGMEGFTFKYPVFKGWSLSKPVLVSKNKCSITVNEDGVNSLIKRDIIVAINPDNIPSDPNSHRVEHSINKDGDNITSVEFLTSIGTVNISSGVGGSYSRELLNQFFQTVIESFKLTK